MKAILASLLIANAAFAADDAPIIVRAGDVMPVSGVLLPDALAVRRAQDLVACKAEVASLTPVVRDSVSPAVVVLIAVGGVLLGGAVGFAVARAVK